MRPGPGSEGHHGNVPVATRPSQRATSAARFARRRLSRRHGSRRGRLAASAIPHAAQPRASSAARTGARGWSATAAGQSPLARAAKARVIPQPGHGRWNRRRSRQMELAASPSGVQAWSTTSPAIPQRPAAAQARTWPSVVGKPRQHGHAAHEEDPDHRQAEEDGADDAQDHSRPGKAVAGRG